MKELKKTLQVPVPYLKSRYITSAGKTASLNNARVNLRRTAIVSYEFMSYSECSA
jgi:hypothetical protein